MRMRRKTKTTNQDTMSLRKREMVRKHSVGSHSEATTCVSEATSKIVSPERLARHKQPSGGFLKQIYSMMKLRRRSEEGIEKRKKSKGLHNNIVSKEIMSSQPNYENDSSRSLSPHVEQQQELRDDASTHDSILMITDEFSNVRTHYHVDPKPIGRGHYGTVRKCMDRETGEWFAIKSIKKSKIKDPNVVISEIEILTDMNHPNVIKLVDVHEDLKFVHIITELCTGGELFERIVSKKGAKYTEKDAAKVLKSILEAVAYCHEEGITHRDLKPENFLFQTEAEDSPIKIIDFGLATQETGVLTSRVGTAYYIAPEVLKRRYTQSCDIWSVGVIAYILLCGYPPFHGDTNKEIFRRLKIGKFDFPKKDWDDISFGAMHFVCYLLQQDPSKRPSAEQALDHEWIRSAR
mmetsp:Transcript_24233/g.35608  ORF Transcript_24233/g.35608 Transcript_24233/m.35608 type:complete len:406 (-) Transcript_24233:84-1301(-)